MCTSVADNLMLRSLTLTTTRPITVGMSTMACWAACLQGKNDACVTNHYPCVTNAYMQISNWKYEWNWWLYESTPSCTMCALTLLMTLPSPRSCIVVAVMIFAIILGNNHIAKINMPLTLKNKTIYLDKYIYMYIHKLLVCEYTFAPATEIRQGSSSFQPPYCWCALPWWSSP